MAAAFGLGPPWGLQPSLKALVEDAGIDFDSFIAAIEEGLTDEETALRFGVTENTVKYLREHFEKYGLDSVMGQD
jgi:hypothetical protein